MSLSAAQRWLLGLTRPYRGRLLLATVLLSVHSLVPVALVWLVEGLLDQALTGNNTALWAIPLAIVGLYAVNALTHISRSMITRGVAWELVTANRKLLFERLLSAPIDSHRARQLGATLTHLSDDVSALQYALSAVVTAIQKPITIVGLLVSAWLLQPTLSLIAIVALPLLILPMRLLQRWLRHSSASELAARSQLRAVLTDVLRNALTIKLSDASPFEQQVEQANQQLFHSKRQLIWHQAISSPLIELVGALIIALTLTIGGQAVVAGDSSSGELMAFLVAIGLLSAPLKGLGEALPLWHTASAAAERLFPLLQERKAEASSHPPLPAAPLSIELKDLSFAFDQPLFLPISLTLPAGSCVAITGASGVGKSTLLEGIMGLRSPSQGQILLNGLDNSQVDPTARRQRLAMVPQQPGFFNQSIRFNLCLGREYDDAALWAALEQVGLRAEVGQRGLDAAMLDNGAGWSGGQRRRLAIARALLGQPQVLLIDEPFNGLDADTAEGLWQLLVELNVACTLVLVVHEERWAERCGHILGLFGN